MRPMLDSRRVAAGALLLLPAGLVAFFAFNSGGFYPGPPSYAAVVLCIALVLRLTVASNPFGGAGLGMALVAGALAVYALLTLLSEIWSHAPGQALVEYDRALLYLLAFVLFGTIVHTPERVRWTLRALALTIVVICACSLITRLLPHVWSTAPEVANRRLSFPLTYWNALGLLGGFGMASCLHLSSDRHSPVATRSLAAAAIPIVATTIYFTFSRGGIITTGIGVVVYALIARPKMLVSTLLSAAPATAVALTFAYHANLLATPNPTTSAAVVQGRHVAIAVIASAVTAALVRALLALVLDERMERLALPARRRRLVRRLGWSALGVGALVVVIALNGVIAHEYQRFIRQASPGSSADLRTRLTDPGNNGRIDMWRVGWEQFQQAPVLGHGAGTFQNTWAKYRPTQDFVLDAHSLYVETLDELGVVGFVLLVGAIGAILVRTAARARGPERSLYAATFAVMIMWALHTGVDWDWEMPVVTLPFFALGGMMLSRPLRNAAERLPAGRRRAAQPYVRTAEGICCLLLAVAPAYVWLSQRRLDQATAAFGQGNCRQATRSALSSISILGDRPEPYEVIAYCDIRRDIPDLAIGAIHKAISLDPANWNFRYDLAVMLASAGLDPVPAARKALSLDPREPLVQQAMRTFSPANRSRWKDDGKAIADALTSL